MTFTRRSFLHTLGLAATGMALQKVVPSEIWHIPENVIAYDGPASMEWMLAAALASLASNLPSDQFRHIPGSHRLSADGMHMLAVDIADDFSMTKDRMKRCYIDPAMAALGEAIRERKPKICLSLALPPHAAELKACGKMVNERHGLDLRFLRAQDMSVYPEVRFINRFDVMVA
jgi:hypothetical protein